MNVRLVGSQRVHKIYDGESGIMRRAMVPACGVSAGTTTRRFATDEPVNCPTCAVEPTRVEIRTDDAAWAAEHGTPLRDGKTVIEVVYAERTTFAGQPMVSFKLPSLPSDWLNANALVPAAWIV
jgi:hypothetical protein